MHVVTLKSGQPLLSTVENKVNPSVFVIKRFYCMINTFFTALYCILALCHIFALLLPHTLLHTLSDFIIVPGNELLLQVENVLNGFFAMAFS